MIIDLPLGAITTLRSSQGESFKAKVVLAPSESDPCRNCVFFSDTEHCDAVGCAKQDRADHKEVIFVRE